MWKICVWNCSPGFKLFAWVCMLNVRTTKQATSNILELNFVNWFFESAPAATWTKVKTKLLNCCDLSGFRCHSYSVHGRKCSHRITVITLCINQESEFRWNVNRLSFNWKARNFFFFVTPTLYYVHVSWASGDATMDFHSGEPRAHIRAPSLKRGKNDNGLNERVSLKLFSFFRSITSLGYMKYWLHCWKSHIFHCLAEMLLSNFMCDLLLINSKHVN